MINYLAGNDEEYNVGNSCSDDSDCGTDGACHNGLCESTIWSAAVHSYRDYMRDPIWCSSHSDCNPEKYCVPFKNKKICTPRKIPYIAKSAKEKMIDDTIDACLVA